MEMVGTEGPRIHPLLSKTNFLFTTECDSHKTWGLVVVLSSLPHKLKNEKSNPAEDVAELLPQASY